MALPSKKITLQKKSQFSIGDLALDSIGNIYKVVYISIDLEADNDKVFGERLGKVYDLTDDVYQIAMANDIATRREISILSDAKQNLDKLSKINLFYDNVLGERLVKVSDGINQEIENLSSVQQNLDNLSKISSFYDNISGERLVRISEMADATNQEMVVLSGNLEKLSKINSFYDNVSGERLVKISEMADVTNQETVVLSSNLDNLSKINSFIEPKIGKQKVLIKA